MDNVCLLVIDPRIIEPLEHNCRLNNLDLLRMGDPGIELPYNDVRVRGGHVPNDTEPVEFILNAVRFTQFMEGWANTAIPGRTVHWIDSGRNRYDGVNATVIMYLAEIANTNAEPARPRLRPRQPATHDWIPEHRPTTNADPYAHQPTPDADPYAHQPTPREPIYVDEEERYDEEGDYDEHGLYDDEGEFHPEWVNAEPPPRPAEFDVMCEATAADDEAYNQELARLRERTMTLTTGDIDLLAPLNGLHWNSDTLKSFMVEHFSALNRKVIIRCPAGAPYLEMQPTQGIFHILIFSTPKLGEQRTVSGDVMRRILDPIAQNHRRQNNYAISTSSMFAPVNVPLYNERQDIVDPTTGVVLAQLFNQKYLYILFHATSTESQREKDVLKYVITAALASMSSLPSAIRNQYQIELATTKDRLEEIAQEKLKVALNRLFTSQFRSKQATLTREIESLDADTESYLREINGFYKLISVKRSELEAIEKSIEKADEGLNINEFFNHPKVTGVHPAGNTIKLTTSHLFFTIPDNQLVFDLGVIDIIMQLEGSALPYLKNQTRVITGLESGMHHPHVFPRGNPCWGNVSQTLQTLFNDGEIKSYIDVVIAYLETVNIRDAAGEKAYRWPLAAAQHQTVPHYLDTYKDAIRNVGRTGDIL